MIQKSILNKLFHYCKFSAETLSIGEQWESSIHINEFYQNKIFVNNDLLTDFPVPLNKTNTYDKIIDLIDTSIWM